MLLFLLGVLSTLVLGILANLLTPGVPVIWRKLRRWQNVGYHSHIRQQLKGAQSLLDQHVQITTGSAKDLFLYLFRWLLAIFAVFILAVACAFLSVTSENATTAVRENLRTAGLVCLIVATAMSIVVLTGCRHYTDTGMETRRKFLEQQVEKLAAKLPPA